MAASALIPCDAIAEPFAAFPSWSVPLRQGGHDQRVTRRYTAARQAALRDPRPHAPRGTSRDAVVLLVNWLGQSDDPSTGNEAAGQFIEALVGLFHIDRAERTTQYRIDRLIRGTCHSSAASSQPGGAGTNKCGVAFPDDYGGGMTQALTERYAERIAGVLSCYDCAW